MKNKKKDPSARKKDYSDELRVLFLVSIYILLFIFVNIFISSVMFIFHISIIKWYALLSFIISAGIILFFLKKSEILNIKNVGISIVLPVFLIVMSFYANSKFIDSTWDGNSYHKVTVGLLANGWNPLYETMEEFDKNASFTVHVNENNSIWGEHYAKASHIFAANIYSLTGDIESGKCINTLSIIMLFFIVFTLMLYYYRKVIFSLLFAACAVSLPSVCSQYLTFYVDSLVYIYLFSTILFFFFFEKKDFIDENIVMLAYIMCLSIAINIKFSVFGYAGLFCLGYYVWYIIRLIKKDLDKKYFIKFTVSSALAVIIGVFVVGLSVYPKNFIDHGHPFYPIMGEDKREIMVQNQPDYFKNKSAIEKFIIATFSKAENISEASGLEAEYKIPFTVSKGELNLMSSCDLRISGNGVFFSGILIISLLIICFTARGVYKKNNKLFWMTMIPVCITVLMIFLLSESWWARYFPQLFFVVFTSLIYLNELEDKLFRMGLYAFMILILINNLLFFVNSTKASRSFSLDAKSSIYSYICDNDKEMLLYTDSFPGVIYNVIDRKGINNINVAGSDYEYVPGTMVPVVPPYLVGTCK